MIGYNDYFFINKKPFLGEYEFADEEKPLSEYAVAAYVALRSLVGKEERSMICVSANQLCFELFGNGSRTSSDLKYIKKGIMELDCTPLISIRDMDGKSNYILDISNLYTYRTDEDFFIKVYREEVWTIFNVASYTDKYKLLRYFLCILASIDVNTSYKFPDTDDKIKNFVGNSAFKYLSKTAGISDKSSLTYNSILEDNELIYIKRSNLINIAQSGDSAKTIPAHYGRFKDQNYIRAYSRIAEKAAIRMGAYSMPLFQNLKRSMDTKYRHFTEGKKYTDEELLAMCAFYYSHGKYIEIRKKQASSQSVIDNLTKKSVSHPLLHDFLSNYLESHPECEEDFKLLVENFDIIIAKERSVRVELLKNALNDEG